MRPSDRYAVAVFGALIVLTAIAGYLWPLGFSAVPPIAAILLIALYRPRDPNPVFLSLLALMFAGLISLAWSPVFMGVANLADYADIETQTWGKLVLQLGLYAVLVSVAAARVGPRSRRLRALFVGGTALLAVVLLVEALNGAGLYQAIKAGIGDPIRPDLARRNVAQGAYVLALMLWPAWSILGDWGWRRTRLLLLIAAMAAPLLLDAQAPAVAIAAAGAVYALSRRRPGRAAVGFGIVAALVVLGAPFVVLAARPLFEAAGGFLGPSWAARLEIWNFTADQVMNHPLLGWGLDGSRAFLPFMLHPHAAPLQIWLELGAVGAVLLAAFWFLLCGEAGRRGPQALATAATYFVIGGLSFGMWQEWWLGLGATACVWALLAARREPEAEWVIEA